MTDVNQLITDHLDVWTAAIEKKSSAGRGNSGAITLYGIKKLRALILELAVRGKLVPQDENDGGVAFYLDEILRLRNELVRHGKSKKTKALPEVAKGEVPFDVPESWVWTRLQDVTGYIQRGKSPKYAEDGQVQVVSQKCVQWGQFDLEKARFINDASVDTYGPERFLRSGDILWNSTGTGTVGRVLAIEVENDQTLVADSHVTVVRSISGCPRFLEVFLSSAGIQDRIDPTHERSLVSGSTKQVELNVSTVTALPVPLPPLEEQNRIVAKVDELMGLCDALERQAEDSLKAHQTLVETCLATLTNSQTPEDLTQNWTRIEAHFDTLFTTEESVARLETTVLELAIRGLLVSQDPSDEPAATWLERAIRTRDKLVKAKTIRKPKATKDVDGLPKPYALPESWTWARLPEVGELARGKSKHRPRNDRRLFDGGEYPLVQTGDVARANPFIVESESFYNDFGLQQSRLWPRGTLCITIAANIADTGILAIDACFPDSVVGYIPFEDDVDVTYFDYFIRTAKNDLEHYAPSTAQKNINLEILGEVLVPLPPKAELSRICDRVSDLLKICKMLRQRIRDLESSSVKLADTLTSKIH
ncbi:type I restriction enzyme, S subunit [Aliiroseovarius sediminilitoris]|uniref:Type I restriction enzyme, S subunit n=1 Tax=Aliiroseovarius sediminilitoris TaxID=1173584 RepID=A0A1I0NVY9_9RHOB|nr:restriction endonuclease subunit S [Aliiroseovarius sediminilitoris]SEW05148.1 type I restriction enzyme, S subunit [Aliiroseovarius sediminilitoris]